MWETLVNFVIAWISLWLISKILGKGLSVNADGLFLAACANTLFSAITCAGFMLLPLPIWIKAILLIAITLVGIPIFTFWFADRFIDGFKLKNPKKYFIPACLWFVLITFVGMAIVNMIPFLGLGMFGMGSRYTGYRAHPGWFYSYEDYYYFYE